MGTQVSLSGQNLELDQIAAHFTDVETSLRRFFTNPHLYPDRFGNYSLAEVTQELNARLIEEEKMIVLSILASIEATFRIDYLQRVYAKKKDALSRALRQLHLSKGSRASLEDDILEAWKNHTTISVELIGHIRSAFKFRHWLAHGRYWTPKLGRQYDYPGVYTLAHQIQTTLPLLR